MSLARDTAVAVAVVHDGKFKQIDKAANNVRRELPSTTAVIIAFIVVYCCCAISSKLVIFHLEKRERTKCYYRPMCYVYNKRIL